MSLETVVKRNGLQERFDVNKLADGVRKATAGIGVWFNVDKFIKETIASFPATITTEQVSECLIKTAVGKIALEDPEWDKIAARLFLQKIFKEVARNLGVSQWKKYYSEEAFEFGDYIRLGIKLNKLTHRLNSGYVLGLQDFIKGSRNDLFTYLGIKTLYDKYLIKAKDKTALETPQMMFMGISAFLSLKSRDHREAAARYYDALSSFKVMLATPILANARTTRFQLNSCYVGSSGDSIESIFTSFKDMALISKNGGGIGWDFSNIRGMGSTIDGISGVSGGIVPWLKITNDIAIAVDQLGTRKGAIAAWCEIWHIDIEDFIELRKNSGDERRRAHDLFPALWICDLFMNRIIENGDWTLLDPYYYKHLTESWGKEFELHYLDHEEKVKLNPKLPGYKIVKARDLWKKILAQVFETGLPFIGFKDTANKANPNRDSGMIRSSNLCTEIFQNTKPSSLEIKVTYEKNIRNTSAPKETYSRIYPSLGSGFASDACLATPYGDKYVPVTELRSGDHVRDDRNNFKDYDVVRFVTKQSSEDGETAVCTLGSINLSKLSFFDADKTFNPECYTEVADVVSTLVDMLNNVIDLNSYPIETAKNSQDANRAIGIGIMGEAELIATNKIRYGSLSHKILINNIMESISYNAIKASNQMLRDGSQPYTNCKTSKWALGMMPYELNQIPVLEEANFSLGDIIRDESCDWLYLSHRVRNEGLRNGYLLAIAPTSSISILCGTTQSVEPYYGKYWYEENISGLIPAIAPGWSKDLEEYFVTAYELNPLELIDLAVIRQRWIDQGQSLNLFVQPDIKGGDLSHLYMTAWKQGLKSVYYCRTKSKEITSATMVACPIDCESCQ